MAVCSGDAIQCAILTESHKDRCAEQKRFDDLQGTSALVLGQALLAGTDPATGTMPTVGNGASVNVPGTLDRNGWMGGGGCFQDRTISGPFGTSYAISFSVLCTNLVAIRYGIMIVAGLISAAVIGRAISS